MQIKKGTPPATVERPIAVELTREEVLSILVTYIKTKLGSNTRFEDIQVTGDEMDKLHSVTVAGVELVPLSWQKDDPSSRPTQPATVQGGPISIPAVVPPVKKV